MRVIALTLEDDITEVYNTGIIRRGENLATQLSITLPADLVDLDYKLVFQLNGLTPVTVDTLVPVANIITYDIPSTLTAYSGELKFEFNAYNISGTLIKSSIYALRVRNSII